MNPTPDGRCAYQSSFFGSQVMALRCAICGSIAQTYHFPRELEKCFYNMSKGDIDKNLKQHGDPKLQVKLLTADHICQAKIRGRNCYRRAWTVISACEDYVKRKYKEVDEVAVLQATCGVQIDEHAALGVGRRKHVEALPEPSPTRRLCGTPGCALLDRHAGLCEPDKVDGKRMRCFPAILMKSPIWWGDKRLSIRVGEAYQAQVPPWVPGQRGDRVGYLREKRTLPMTNRESERSTRQRRSQCQHLLARDCLITRFARDKHLGVEMATRDALQGGDILCVLTGIIVVCHMNPLEPSTPITLPIPFTNLNPLIHSIPSASEPRRVCQSGGGGPLVGQVLHRI